MIFKSNRLLSKKEQKIALQAYRDGYETGYKDACDFAKNIIAEYKEKSIKEREAK